jgi:hypothetical protein
MTAVLALWLTKLTSFFSPIATLSVVDTACPVDHVSAVVASVASSVGKTERSPAAFSPLIEIVSFTLFAPVGTVVEPPHTTFASVACAPIEVFVMSLKGTDMVTKPSEDVVALATPAMIATPPANAPIATSAGPRNPQLVPRACAGE